MPNQGREREKEKASQSYAKFSLALFSAIPDPRLPFIFRLKLEKATIKTKTAQKTIKTVHKTCNPPSSSMMSVGTLEDKGQTSRHCSNALWSKGQAGSGVGLSNREDSLVAMTRLYLLSGKLWHGPQKQDVGQCSSGVHHPSKSLL